MRCPKCGYISFDHIKNCLKCDKEVQKAAEELHGTVFNAAAPNFLKFEPQTREEETESSFDDDFVDGEIEMDAIDPDLDILLDDDSAASDEEGEDGFSTDETAAASDEGGTEDDISIDFNQFEDADLGDEEESEEQFAMDVPEELADLSDLEPQDETLAATETMAATVEEPEAPAADELDDFGDTLDFDLDLDGLDDGDLGESTTGTSAEEPTLSFDDPDVESDEQKKKGDDSADLDLDFDLDLDGLSLDK